MRSGNVYTTLFTVLRKGKKTTLITTFLAGVLLVCSAQASAQVGIITTVVGNGTAAITGDGGAATAAQVNEAYAVACDASGNIYIADFTGNTIRMINSSGIISTIAGNGTAGSTGDGGPATAALLKTPAGIVVDASGNIFIADYGNNRVREITSGIINTIAGNGTNTEGGNGGAATSATLSGPVGIAVDGSGNIFISDYGGSTVRRITSGIINAYAGTGTSGFSGDGGAATAAQISGNENIALDATGNLYITDNSNNRIRMVSPAGIITTFAGNGTASSTGDGSAATAATVNTPKGIAVDASGNVYISEFGGQRVRIVNPSGIINTYAGTGTAGYTGDGIPATSFELNTPRGLAMNSSGVLYIADDANHRVRAVKPDATPTFTGGSTQSLGVCANSTGNSINPLLQITDADAGQTETFTVTSGPSHGSVTTGTTVGSGTSVSPTGWSYAPTTSYSGSDVFVVQVSDGGAIATTTINVTVSGIPTITSVSPLLGYPASSVSITGTGFNATTTNNIVYFGATQATVTAATTTSLNVTVPTGATFAQVTETIAGCGMAASQFPYMPYFNNSAYVSGTTNFDPYFTLSVGSTPNDVAVGDLDGDGKPDIVSVDMNTNMIYVSRNISSGGTLSSSSFSSPVAFATAHQYIYNNLYVAIADIDGDGKLDIIVSNNNVDSISVFLNTSTPGSITTGSFAARVNFTLPGVPTGIAIADFDKDGKPDIAACNNGNTISILKNTSTPGTLSMATHVDFTAGSSSQGLVAADFDGDGLIDLACANNYATSANNITVLRNTSSGSISFASGVSFNGPWAETGIVAVDLNGDGKLDIAAVGYSGLSIWQNTATSGVINSSSFGAHVDFGASFNEKIAVGDFDGDGKPDLVGTYYGASSIRVFRNVTVGTGSTLTTSSLAPYINFPSVAQNGLAVADLNADGLPDIVTDYNAIAIIQNDPLKLITGIDTVCAGANTTLADATAHGTWSSSSTAVATVGSTTGVVHGVSGGIVTITYAGTAGASYSGNYVTQTVTVNAASVSVTAGSAVCSGTGGVTLTASAASTYTWSPATNLSATTGNSVVASPSVTTTYSVTGTNSIGCSTTVAVTATINPLPNFTLTAGGATSFCSGGAVTLYPGGTTSYLNTTPATGSQTRCDCPAGYVVTGYDGLLVSGSTTPMTQFTLHCKNLSNGVVSGTDVTTCANGLAPTGGSAFGPYLFSGNTVLTGMLLHGNTGTYMGMEGFGQTASYIDAKGVNTSGATTGGNYQTSGAALGSVTAPDGNVITGMYTYNTSNATGVAFNYTPEWAYNTGGITWSNSATTSNISVTTSGTYTATITDNNGCSYTAPGITVTVNTLPTVSGGSNVAICSGRGGTTLTASGATTYSWSPSTGLSVSTGTSVVATPTVTTTYTVTGTNSIGCANTATVTVSVNTTPTITVGSNVTICSGNSTTLTASGAVTYSWLPTTSLSPTTGTTVSATPSSTTVYTVTGTSSAGCPNTATVQVSVNTTPTMAFTSPVNTCDSQVTLAASSSTYTSYSWSTGATTSSINAKISGTYSYTVTNNGCPLSGTATVTVVNGHLQTANMTICAGTTVTLNASPFTPSFNPALYSAVHLYGGHTYYLSLFNDTWSDANTSAIAAGGHLASITSSGENSFISSFLTTGWIGYFQNHSSPFYSEPAGGWEWTTGETATYTPWNSGEPNNFGSGEDNAEILASGLWNDFPNSSLLPYVIEFDNHKTYSWSTGDTTIAAVVTPTTTTTYYCTSTVNGQSCVDSVVVTVNPKPTITASSNVTVCNGTSTPLTASGGVSYSWLPTTGLSPTTGASVNATPGSTTTYTVTGTSSLSCTNKATVQVSVNALPVMSVTPTFQQVCNNANTTAEAFTSNIAGTTYTWSNSNTSIGTGASGSGSAIASFTATNTGSTPVSGVFTVTPTANSCIGAVKTFTITVEPTPIMSVTPTFQQVCNLSNTATEVFTSNVTGTTYTWSNSNTSIGTGASGSGSTISSFTATNSGSTATSGVFTVTPTANSCPGPVQNFTITVEPTPVMSVTPTAQQVCNLSNTTTEAFTSNVTGTTYTWSNSNTSIGTGASGSGSAIASFTATNSGSTPVSGVFTVTPTANSCIGAVKTFTITVEPTPVMSVTPTSQQVCNNANTTTEVFTSNVTGTTYTWSNSNTSIGTGASGSGSAIASFTATNSGSTATSGVFTVTPTANSCPGPVQNFTITVEPTPVMSVTPTSQQACNLSNTTTEVFTSNVTGTTYTWSNSNTSIGTGASGSGSAIAPFTATNTGSTPIVGVFTVTPTANGCTGPVQNFTITVNPTPAVSAGANVTICSGVITPLTASGATTYTWSPATALSATTGSTVNANPTTTITYTVTGTTSAGCPNTATVMVSVNTTPTMAFTSPVNTCDSQVTLAASSSTYTSYSWSNGATTSSINAKVSGTYLYTVTGSGCTTTGSVAVTVVNGHLQTANMTICAGTTVTLNASPFAPSFNPALYSPVHVFGGHTYYLSLFSDTWSNANNSAIAAGGHLASITSSAENSFISSFLSTGWIGYFQNRSSSLYVEPAGGWEWTTGEAATYVPWNSGEPNNAGGIEDYAEILSSALWNDLPNSSSLPYVIEFDNVKTYSWSTGATTIAAVVTPSVTTTYYCTSTVNGQSCVDSVVVTVNPKPTITASSNVTVCNGTSTPLTASGGVSYSWLPTTGLSPTTGASVNATPGSTTTYTVTGTSSLSCTNTATVQVSVNALPSITATPAGTVTICSGITTALGASGGSTYTWSPSTALSATTGSSVNANPTSTITYTVTGTNSVGCSNTATKLVSVNTTPVITGTTSMIVGTTTTLSATPSGGSWISASPAIATIGSSTGIVLGVLPGTSLVTYTAISTCTANVTVSVNASVWYSNVGGGDASDLTKWWSTNVNTGSHPTVFSAPTDIWIYQSAMTCTASSFSQGGNVSIIAGGSFTPFAGGTWSIGGTYTNAGVFTHNNGTVIFNGSGTGIALAGSITGTNMFNNVTFNAAGSSWSFGANSVDAHNFTITAGTVIAPSTTLQISGNYSNSGTFTNNGGTVVMNGTSGTYTLGGTMTGTSKFHNVTFNGIGGIWSFGTTNATINGNCKVLNGKLKEAGNTLLIGH